MSLLAHFVEISLHQFVRTVIQMLTMRRN